MVAPGCVDFLFTMSRLFYAGGNKARPYNFIGPMWLIPQPQTVFIYIGIIVGATFMVARAYKNQYPSW